ncbi:MAG TPA: KUP/HAK/KT family potassium transporter, partial [Labilithrix sp.]|nr:KUP/HAK/KT family potassium transporter [Labilithrix sp.]
MITRRVLGPLPHRLARTFAPSSLRAGRMADARAEVPPAPAKAGGIERPPKLGLALGALGVVYGDIGTNPLFALQEAFGGSEALPRTPANVLGVLSLVFWSLVVVVSIKYLTFVMRASNQGEGGILALLALVPKTAEAADGKTKERPAWLVLLV